MYILIKSNNTAVSNFILYKPSDLVYNKEKGTLEIKPGEIKYVFANEKIFDEIAKTIVLDTDKTEHIVETYILQDTAVVTLPIKVKPIKNNLGQVILFELVCGKEEFQKVMQKIQKKEPEPKPKRPEYPPQTVAVMYPPSNQNKTKPQITEQKKR